MDINPPRNDQKAPKSRFRLAQTPMRPAQKALKRRLVLKVCLARPEIESLAEIAASVVRHNQLARVPSDWREIPAWWGWAKRALPASTYQPDTVLRRDIRRAISVLQSCAKTQKPPQA